jgi:rod shape-determining protein MreC
MALPDIRQRSGYLLAVVVIGQIIMISTQVNARPGVSLLRATVFGAFAEVQRASGAVVEGTRGAWNGYVALRGVREENVALATRARDLSVALQRERALAGESRQLRQLLALRDRTDLPTRAADVVGSSPTADFRTLTINLGTGDGVSADIPSRRAAKVQLLVDRNAAVAVMIARSRVQGIAMGSGENLLRLEYVPGSADLVSGDEVVTSGIDGIYPPGFAVGRVETIERLGGSFRSIRVRPAVDFSTLEQVLVVMARPAPGAAGEKAP